MDRETNRSNLARELELNRSNIARENETSRANVAQELLGYTRVNVDSRNAAVNERNAASNERNAETRSLEQSSNATLGLINANANSQRAQAAAEANAINRDRLTSEKFRNYATGTQNLIDAATEVVRTIGGMINEGKQENKRKQR
nr:putative ORF1 [Marmot picobirnavirus]